MRVLGLDYGSKTVGVAISDPLLITAGGVEIIRRDSEKKIRKTLARIDELIAQYNVEKIVIGLPKNMDNSIGERANKTMEFAEMIRKRTGLEVIMQDERLSTVSAYRTMMDVNVKGSERYKYVDQIAATFILQTYLDGLSNNNKGESALQEI